MNQDERAIRELIATWMSKSAAGDVQQVLPLMAEDVVFLVPGHPPMRGREAFAAGFKAATGQVRMQGTSQVQEIQVVGEWAYCWSQLSLVVTPLSGDSPVHRAGNVLSIFKKKPDGGWVLFRDANLLTVVSP